MIQNIVKVKSTTTLQGKKGPYLSVVWADGDKEFKKNVFEPAHQKVFQQAEKSGESVKVGVEKEGDFFNVKSAEITTGEVTEQPKQDKVQDKAYTKPSRSPSEMHSIECQTKMNNAREIYNHCTDGGIPFDSELLLKIYQTIADIMRNDGALINEIKKEGGVEE